MKYNISIDQPRCIEWKLSHAEAFMFSFCYSLPSWATPIFINGEVYYFASRNKAIEEMPLITNKPDTVYRLYKALAEKGLIDFVKFDNKDCIKLTEKSKAWNSEKNPSVGKKSEELGKKSEKDSEKNPTNNRTILDNKTTDTSLSQNAKTEIEPKNFSEETPPPSSAPPPPQKITTESKLTDEEISSPFAFVLASDMMYDYLTSNEGQLEVMKSQTRFSGTDEDLKNVILKYFSDKADNNYVLRQPCARNNIGRITIYMSNFKNFEGKKPTNHGRHQASKNSNGISESRRQIVEALLD